MKLIVMMVSMLLLVSILAGGAFAATWQCRWCGRKQSAPNKPAAMSNCPKNPYGKHHDWVKIS